MLYPLMHQRCSGSKKFGNLSCLSDTRIIVAKMSFILLRDAVDPAPILVALGMRREMI